MTSYIINLLVLICVNATLAVTLNFIMGYAGIFSLAHAIFFGIGSYVAAYVALHFTGSLLVILPAAMLISALVGLALALPALRVRGEYFVAASLGLQVIGVTVFSEWKSVTGGIGGVMGFPPASLPGLSFESPTAFLIWSVVMLVLILLAINTLLHSSFGRNLQAIRDSESAALAYGKNVAMIKTLSVVFSSALAATAGVVYAFYMSFVNVESFTLDTSVLVMAMVIIGGTGTIWGPLVGAVLLMLIPSLTSYIPGLPQTEVGSIQQIIYGAAMVLLMIFRPGGIMGGKHGGVK
ncbi:branched-chain amino acid ABC transporter permease [Comamonas serinivorans]|uniref:Branched-chain amino acid ABC transporter permease n=1 Tax=Comamonas serinivorans TaxID=1082851 RepID=A0A1Y0EJ90_9BURK|nr:branched-chain amino acid ABC transporter permease [Comamonas serinivorans]ARU03342.1 branched-chain amino acid ABC transporter permease [Comamonas serinivorans]